MLSSEVLRRHRLNPVQGGVSATTLDNNPATRQVLIYSKANGDSSVIIVGLEWLRTRIIASSHAQHLSEKPAGRGERRGVT